MRKTLSARCLKRPVAVILADHFPPRTSVASLYFGGVMNYSGKPIRSIPKSRDYFHSLEGPCGARALRRARAELGCVPEDELLTLRKRTAVCRVTPIPRSFPVSRSRRILRPQGSRLPRASRSACALTSKRD